MKRLRLWSQAQQGNVPTNLNLDAIINHWTGSLLTDSDIAGNSGPPSDHDDFDDIYGDEAPPEVPPAVQPSVQPSSPYNSTDSDEPPPDIRR